MNIKFLQNLSIFFIMSLILCGYTNDTYRPRSGKVLNSADVVVNEADLLQAIADNTGGITGTLTIQTSQDLSLGPLDFTTTIGSDFQMEEIDINIVGGLISEEITITKTFSDPNYSTIRYNDNWTNIDNFVWDYPDGPIKCIGSELNVYITNVNLTGIAYVTITYTGL